jgi:hypothetical protein
MYHNLSLKTPPKAGISTFEELKWQSFTDLYEALRVDSNLQWSQMKMV